MSLFGIGGSKGSSSSSSESYGYSGSSSLSDSLSTARGVSESSGVSTSTQDIAFQDLFSQLYGGAAAAAGKITGEVPMNAAQMLFSGGTGFLDSLSGGSANEYLERRLSDENPVLQQQIDSLGGDLGRFFNEQLNPAITGQAVAGGTLGGGRQGVAQAGAMREVGDQFMRGATALRGGDIAARDAAAQGLMSGRTAAAGVGLGALPGMFGLAQQGSLAGLAPYQALAGILGGPTTLTTSRAMDSASSVSSSDAVARAISESFGEDFSKSKSKSSNVSASIGFG